MDDHKKFKKECKKEISKQSINKKFINLSQKWIEESIKQNIRIILIGLKTYYSISTGYVAHNN